MDPVRDLRPAIVFIHGTRLTGAAWVAQRAGLGDTYRVITPDLPGHGTRADEPFTLAGAADGIATLITEEVGGAAVVVGLSLGGFVAMDLAARRPELVRGLVLAGASAEPTGLLTLPLRVFSALMTSVDPAVQASLNAWYFRRRYPPAIAEPLIAGGFHAVGGVQALRALDGQRFAPRLAAYPGPTLIVNGAWDPFFRLGAPAFAAVAVSASRVRIAGAAHLSNLDRPAAFNGAVRRFVASLPTAAR